MIYTIKDALLANIRALYILVLSLSLLPPVFGQQKHLTIVIDPGHGGHDSGCKGHQLIEKQVNLEIALLLGKCLQKLENVNVVYTRQSDIFIPLRKRASLANGLNADIFISIHSNAASSKQAYGTETFIFGSPKNYALGIGEDAKEDADLVERENGVIHFEANNIPFYEQLFSNTSMDFHSNRNGKSLEIAKNIEYHYKNDGHRKSRGVKQARFLVLKMTNMPAVLTEIGFLTNFQEEVYLAKRYNMEATAYSIAKGIEKYIKSQNNTLDTPKSYTVHVVKTQQANIKQFDDIIYALEEHYDGLQYSYLIKGITSLRNANKAIDYLKKKGYKDVYLVIR